MNADGLNLKSCCHVNTNEDGDRFVGIKADGGGVSVRFPMGYRLPDDEEELRQDILLLLSVLSEFGTEQGRLQQNGRLETPRAANFPISAYMTMIRRYLSQNAYYAERETVRRVSDRGKIDWAASLRRNAAFVEEDGTPRFNRYTVRGAVPNEESLLTRIHKYCVYVSFKRLGWLFTKHLPPNPRVENRRELFLYALRKKLNRTHVEGEKELFQSMIAILEHLDASETDERFYFGTERFEYVWEKLIDGVFGVADKKDYFPHTYWTLKYAKTRRNAALEPDSVMIYNEKTYVLDAKYYRYGITNNPAHLPESSSVNKQITYAEYISQRSAGARYGVFNAFLMPFDRAENAFETNKTFAVVGEASADWKTGGRDYERVFGVVIDTRSMMRFYYEAHESKIKELAETIDRALSESKGRVPGAD